MSTILVVDDMAMCREPIADALRHHGHDVTCADGGAEALDVLRDQKPDLVLLDVTMPDPDGLAVLKVIRRNPDLKEIPVILLTDRAEQDTVAQAAQCGVQGYLLKANFSLDVLLGRVEACIGNAHAATVCASNQASSTLSSGAYAEWRSNIEKSPVASSDAPTRSTTTGPTTPTTQEPASSTLVASRTDPTGRGKPAYVLDDLVPIVTKEKLTKLVNDGLKLKPLAATVHSVMAVTGNANCSAADVAKIVGNDHALSIRLLKLANSSAYSRGRPADGIQTAVQRIGIHEVRRLVMALGVFDQYVGGESTRIDIRLFWEHSLACGLIAAALAKECQYKAPDDCFLWGTLHDVGRVILLDRVPSEYDQVCRVADELELPLEVVEPKLLFLGHSEILKQALEHWQFPNAFVVPVVSHHDSVNRLRRLGPEHSQPAMIVALANRIAHALLLGCSGNETIYPFDDLVEALGVSTSVIEKIAATIPDETRDLKLTMLVHSASDLWPDYGSNVQTKLSTMVRPLCVSNASHTDAFKMFFERLSADTSAETPTLGVIYLRDVREAATVFADYENRERSARCGVLPLIVIGANGAEKLGEAPWRSRPHTVLKTPVPTALLLRSINGLANVQLGTAN